jgi:phosphoglycolate phosphatase-like HAD superfamily hydrolase
MTDMEEFEKWYQETIGDLIRQPSGESYIPAKAETAWQAWQEANRRKEKAIDIMADNIDELLDKIADLEEENKTGRNKYNLFDDLLKGAL